MSIIAIDTETGGFKPAENSLLSITLIELDDALVPKRDLDLFIIPEVDRVISEDAAKINGYTPELWLERGAIPLREAFTRIADWVVPGSIALAHNAPFDRSFVVHQEQKLGIHLGLAEGWLCSLAKFRALTGPLRLVTRNHKLDSLAALCGHWGPDFVRGAHGSKADALACAAGYRWLVEQEKARTAAAAKS